MGRFDLNSPQDFARLTMSTAAGALQELTGQAADTWDIAEGSFNAVLFHVFRSKAGYDAGLQQIVDTGGRRKARFRYPYVDGQTTSDLGRKAEDFDLDILFHGRHYLQGLGALLAELQRPTPGDLMHPVRGRVTCVMEDYQILHQSDARRAAALRLRLTEHSYTLSAFRSTDDSTVKGALSKALDVFKRIQAITDRVQGSVMLVGSLRQRVLQGLAEYRQLFGDNLTAVNRTFNTGGSTDLPSLLPVNEGGGLQADGTPAPGIAVVRVPGDPFADVPVSSAVANALTGEQIAKNTAALRVRAQLLIADLQSAGDGQGALEFHSEVLDVKTSAVLMQDALEKGLASSRNRVITYAVPHLMSVREAAFLNDLSLDRVEELEILNPELESSNYVAAGTTLRVPTS